MSKLAEKIQQALVKAIDNDDLVLPTLPEVALNIRQAAEDPEISISHLSKVIGRIHDMVPINGVPHATHHIQDVLDHRVGGIEEFQIDLRTQLPVLRIVVDHHGNAEHIAQKIQGYWPNAFDLQFVGQADLVRVGRHAKFRHVVTGSAATP